MITVEKIKIFNIDGAVLACRNPLSSWSKSDSYYATVELDEYGIVKKQEDFVVGKKDLDLMKRLYQGGSEHRKFLRQIFVTMTITAPLFWWKEFDTYKVGTTADSTSTMHKIHSKEFTLDDFSHEHLHDKFIQMVDEDGNYYITSPMKHLKRTIELLNAERSLYLATQSKNDWWQMIETLPSNYNQLRTVTMNYENVMNILNQRSNHKLDDWRIFCNILRTLPYIKAVRGEE